MTKAVYNLIRPITNVPAPPSQNYTVASLRLPLFFLGAKHHFTVSLSVKTYAIIDLRLYSNDSFFSPEDAVYAFF